MRSSRVSSEWAEERNSIFSNGRFKEEDAIFKVSCRRCLEEFSCRKSGYSALICEDVRSIRAAILESERRHFKKIKKYKGKRKKKKGASHHSASFSSRRLKPGLESIVQSKRRRVLRSKSSQRIVLGSASTISPALPRGTWVLRLFLSMASSENTVVDHQN